MSYPGVPISSIHAPAPLVRAATASRNSSLNLASTDDAERRAAIDYTKNSIDLTQEHGGRFVVVHLGGVGNADVRRGARAAAAVRQRHARRRARRRAARAVSRRSARSRRSRGSNRRARRCASWSRTREPRGIAIGIENRLHYHEIPQPAEAAWLFAGLRARCCRLLARRRTRRGAVAAGARRQAPVARHQQRALHRLHLHDVTGLADHRAPGNGDVDWGYIATGIPPSALRVFEINQSQPPESVSGAIPFLRERGVI